MHIGVIHVWITWTPPEASSRSLGIPGERVPEGGGNQMAVGMLECALFSISALDGHSEHLAMHVFPKFIGHLVVFIEKRIALIGQFPGMDVWRVSPARL